MYSIKNHNQQIGTSKSLSNVSQAISLNQSSKSQSVDFYEEMLIIEQSPWKQDYHKSAALNQPNFQELNQQNQYQLATPLLDLNADFPDCPYAEFHYQDNSYYQGQQRKSMRFGLGTYYFNNGEQVKGYFINDVPIGRFNYLQQSTKLNIMYRDRNWHRIKKTKSFNGFLSFHNSNGVYIGQFKNGSQKGSGKLYQRSLIYSGQFKESKYGRGLIKSYDGTILIGSFLQGYCQGNAIKKFPNGNLYIGKWILGKPEGFGNFIQAQQTQKGHWINGQRQGKFAIDSDKLHFTVYYQNDEFTQVVLKEKLKLKNYVGEHKNKQLDGYGATYDGVLLNIGYFENEKPIFQASHRHIISNKTQIEYIKAYLINKTKKGIGYCCSSQHRILGDLCENTLHGEGIQINVLKGIIKIGTWVNGSMHGYGQMISHDNSYYVGDWQQDQFHGYGTYDDGKQKYVGWWIEGNRSGKGETRWEDNSVYKGDWLNNQRHGFGTQSDPIRGTELTGYWYQDQHLSGVSNSKIELIQYRGMNLFQIKTNQENIETIQQGQSMFIEQDSCNQLYIDNNIHEKYLGKVSKKNKDLQNIFCTQIHLQRLFCGSFCDDKLNGAGQILELQKQDTNYSVGYFVFGYFKQKNIISGQQRVLYEIYLGKFQGNEPNGQGTLVKPNGDFFIGNHYSGLPHGHGILYIHDSKRYFEGIFCNGRMEKKYSEKN